MIHISYDRDSNQFHGPFVRFIRIQINGLIELELKFKMKPLTKELVVMHSIQRSGIPIRSGPEYFKSLELHFEADRYFEGQADIQFRRQTLFKVRRWIPRINIKGLECYRTSKIFFEFGGFPVAFRVKIGFLRSMAFWTHHRQNFEDLQLLNTTGLNFEDSASKRNFEGLRLPERLMDRILKLLNTTGLNFEDSASKRNFEGLRLPERLMDRILKICGFIVSHERNFKDLWLSGCFLKDFEGI
ncbi:hypothetical protein RclHR1_01500004 [Rhizophagus clarus]|uniref:Uncharacterized protein n=1 Tax=Rhizophagus clarus TaxID=94130 RepID=A0A2Z6QTD8_9GLOM|nr:hypothetical protein RclHR1_01500004 [Rhizophagus clarus]